MELETFGRDLEIPDIIELRASEVEPNCLGAWSKTLIAKNRKFGPYVGDVINERDEKKVDFRFAWEVFDLDTGQLMFIINATEPGTGNWMRYVNCARYFEEQNIVSVQDGTEVYYRAMKDIKAGEELLTWFSAIKRKRRRKRKKSVPEKNEDLTYDIPTSPQTVASIISEKRDAGKRKITKTCRLRDSVELMEVSRKKSKCKDRVSDNTVDNDKQKELSAQPKKKLKKKGKKVIVSENKEKTKNMSDDVDNDTVKTPIILDGVEWTYPEPGNEFHYDIHKAESLFRNGIKVFRCDICDGVYKHIFSLKRHYLRNHINCRYLSETDISNSVIDIIQQQTGIASRILDKKKGNSLQSDQVKNCDNVNESKNSITNIGSLLCNESELDDSNDSKSGVLSANLKEKTDRNEISSSIKTDEPPLYWCNLCNLLFDISIDLREHVKNHPDVSDDKPFACDGCYMRFKFNKNLVRHKKVHFVDGGASVASDSVTVRSLPVSEDSVDSSAHKVKAASSKVMKEIKIQSTERKKSKKFHCSMCPLVFMREQTLKNHIAKFCGGVDKPFPCKYCGKRFPLEDNLRRHTLYHTTCIVKCKHCSNVFRHIGELRFHMRSKHPEIQMWIQRKSMAKKENGLEINETQLDIQKKRRGRKKKICIEGQSDKVGKAWKNKLGSDSCFKFVCVVCKKRFRAYVNMCRHRRIAHRTQPLEPEIKTDEEEVFIPPEDLPPIDNSPEALNEFYTNVASNIATNLNSYIDGGQDSLSGFRDHINIGDYQSVFQADENLIDASSITWEQFNFPKNYKHKDFHENLVRFDKVKKDNPISRLDEEETEKKAVLSSHNFETDAVIDSNERYMCVECGTICLSSEKYSIHLGKCEKVLQSVLGVNIITANEAESMYYNRSLQDRKSVNKVASDINNDKNEENVSKYEKEKSSEYQEQVTTGCEFKKCDVLKQEDVSDLNSEVSRNREIDMCESDLILIQKQINKDNEGPKTVMKNSNLSKSESIDITTEKTVRNGDIKSLGKEMSEQKCDPLTEGTVTDIDMSCELVKSENVNIMEEQPADDKDSLCSEVRMTSCLFPQVGTKYPDSPEIHTRCELIKSETIDMLEGKNVSEKDSVYSEVVIKSCLLPKKETDIDKTQTTLADTNLLFQKVTKSCEHLESMTSCECTVNANKSYQFLKSESNDEPTMISQSNNELQFLEIASGCEIPTSDNNTLPEETVTDRHSNYLDIVTAIKKGTVEQQPDQSQIEDVDKSCFLSLEKKGENIIKTDFKSMICLKQVACTSDEINQEFSKKKGETTFCGSEIKASQCLAHPERETQQTEDSLQLAESLSKESLKLGNIKVTGVNSPDKTSCMSQSADGSSNPKKVGGIDDDSNLSLEEVKDLKYPTEMKNLYIDDNSNMSCESNCEVSFSVENDSKIFNKLLLARSDSLEDDKMPHDATKLNRVYVSQNDLLGAEFQILSPQRNPQYSYESIAFGKNGAVAYVCSVCRKHFKDVGALLRHQLKKHPSIACHFLEVEQGHDIDYLYYFDPSNVGVLTETQFTVPEHRMGTFKCTRCHMTFKNISRLRVHIINSCAPFTIGKKSDSETVSQRQQRKRMKKKILDILHGGQDFRFRLKDFSGYNKQKFPPEVSKQKCFTGCRKRKVVSVTDTKQALRAVRQRGFDIGYNPHKHIRRRELTEVIESHQCSGCGFKFKTISLLERHIKNCTRKDKFKDLKPMKNSLFERKYTVHRHTCYYCSKGFTYPKFLINHYRHFCAVKKEKGEKCMLTVEDRNTEEELVNRLKLEDEEKQHRKETVDMDDFCHEPNDGLKKHRKGWPRGLKRKARRKNHSWTYIKRKKSGSNDEEKRSSDLNDSVGNLNEAFEDSPIKETTGLDIKKNDFNVEKPCSRTPKKSQSEQPPVVIEPEPVRRTTKRLIKKKIPFGSASESFEMPSFFKRNVNNLKERNSLKIPKCGKKEKILQDGKLHSSTSNLDTDTAADYKKCEKELCGKAESIKKKKKGSSSLCDVSPEKKKSQKSELKKNKPKASDKDKIVVKDKNKNKSMLSSPKKKIVKSERQDCKKETKKKKISKAHIKPDSENGNIASADLSNDKQKNTVKSPIKKHVPDLAGCVFKISEEFSKSPKKCSPKKKRKEDINSKKSDNDIHHTSSVEMEIDEPTVEYTSTFLHTKKFTQKSLEVIETVTEYKSPASEIQTPKVLSVQAKLVSSVKKLDMKGMKCVLGPTDNNSKIHQSSQQVNEQSLKTNANPTEEGCESVSQTKCESQPVSKICVSQPGVVSENIKILNYLKSPKHLTQSVVSAIKESGVHLTDKLGKDMAGHNKLQPPLTQESAKICVTNLLNQPGSGSPKVNAKLCSPVKSNQPTFLIVKKKKSSPEKSESVKKIQIILPKQCLREPSKKIEISTHSVKGESLLGNPNVSVKTAKILQKIIVAPSDLEKGKKTPQKSESSKSLFLNRKFADQKLSLNIPNLPFISKKRQQRLNIEQIDSSKLQTINSKQSQSISQTVDLPKVHPVSVPCSSTGDQSGITILAEGKSSLRKSINNCSLHGKEKDIVIDDFDQIHKLLDALESPEPIDSVTFFSKPSVSTVTDLKHAKCVVVQQHAMNRSPESDISR